MNISKALSKQGELLITLSDFLESAPPDEIELLGDVLVSWSQETSRSKDGNRLLTVLQQVIDEHGTSDDDSGQASAHEGHDASQQHGEGSHEAQAAAGAGYLRRRPRVREPASGSQRRGTFDSCGRYGE